MPHLLYVTKDVIAKLRRHPAHHFWAPIINNLPIRHIPLEERSFHPRDVKVQNDFIYLTVDMKFAYCRDNLFSFLYEEQDLSFRLTAAQGILRTMDGRQFTALLGRVAAVASTSDITLVETDRVYHPFFDALRRAGVRDSAVLEAMLTVPRDRFVEPALTSRAYEDVALPIGHGQTISRPLTVARMLELIAGPLDARARAAARVLEIGTGCGYQAAVLAGVFGEVISIERIRGLHEQARANLRSLRLSNLRLVFGDGQLGVEQAAPFDVVIAAAAGEAIPQAWLEQMRVGGRLIAPVSSGEDQALHLVQRIGSDRWQLTVLDAVRFVPLQGGTA